MNEILPAVPNMSWAQVETAAERSRKQLLPEYCSADFAVNIELIAHWRLEEFGIVFGTTDLEPGVEAKATWNAEYERFELLASSRTYQRLLHGGLRERMTISHELGHLVLHADQIRAIGEASSSPHPVSTAGMFRRRPDIPPYANPERQAEVFGGRFLLPRENVLRAINLSGLNSVRSLAYAFEVSQEAMAVRLRELRIEL